MSIKVNATIGQELYYTEVVAGKNVLITDEPEELGGKNKGFDPKEILATSLASCTAATLRMYLDRKEWKVEKINVEVEMIEDTLNSITIFERTISFENAELDESQKKRLLNIAGKCPIHKVLTNQVEVNTQLK